MSFDLPGKLETGPTIVLAAVTSLRWLACLGCFWIAPGLFAAPPKVACVGDSITEGGGLANPATESYPAKLGKLVNPEFQVRNFGVGGTTLLKEGGSPYWSTTAFRLSHDWNPDLVIIELGTNDSQPQNWQHGTNFITDYEALIATYTNLPSHPRIVLCTPCPVYGNNAINVSPGIVKTNIAPAVRELATRLGHGLIDLHVAMDGHREWFPDSVHPNSKGTTVMAAVVRNAIVAKATGELPVWLTIGRVTPTRAALTWSSDWAGLVLWSTTALRGEGTVWTVVEQVAFNDGRAVRVTNTISGPLRVYRLWQP